MGLRDIVVPKTTIKVPGGEFTVRGVTFADIATIATVYGPQAAMVFSKLQSGAKVDVTEVKSLMATMLPQVPDMAAGVIALAADDYSEEGVAAARNLGFQYQLEALEQIFHLTFVSDAEVKKFMETILRLMTGTTGLVREMRLPLSEFGSGESGVK